MEGAYYCQLKDFPNTYNYYRNLIALSLQSCLSNKDVGMYESEDLFDNHIFIRYLLLEKDREQFWERAEKESFLVNGLSPQSIRHTTHTMCGAFVRKIPLREWLIWRLQKVEEFLRKFAEYFGRWEEEKSLLICRVHNI